jgi:hypothetical protein
MQSMYFETCLEIISITYHKRGPGGSVGIATDYGLDGPGIESTEAVGFFRLGKFTACFPSDGEVK